MPHPLWRTLAAEAATELSDAQLARLDAYLDQLIAKNERINLTRIVDRADAEVRHVADALTLLRFLPKAHGSPSVGGKLVDVGTGGGVPGVILAIARPDVRVTLVDSTRKKLVAIEQMCEVVGVKNVGTLHARIEHVGRKFDVITARAVAELGTLLDWCEPLMHERSTLLAMKGPRAAEEIAAIPPWRRKQFRIEVEPVAAKELEGHCVVRVTRAGR